MSDRKRCTVCGQHKLRAEFSPCRGGVQSACRKCRNASSASMDRPVSVESQACVTCKRVLDAAMFARNRRRSTGLQKECKACCNSRKKALCYPVTLSEKTCRDCGVTKPASEFCRDKKRVGGLRSECRDCTSIRTRAQVYRLPIGQAATMCAADSCEICGDRLPELRDKHIDHCHATGLVRGTLCLACNQMLGHARDRMSILQSGAAYLLRTGTNKDRHYA